MGEQEKTAGEGQPQKKEIKAGGSMVAPHPGKSGDLRPVEELAAEAGMTAPILAGLRRATGWADGKRVTEAEFTDAAGKFNNRPMGGGRL